MACRPSSWRRCTCAHFIAVQVVAGNDAQRPTVFPTGDNSNPGDNQPVSQPNVDQRRSGCPLIIPTRSALAYRLEAGRRLPESWPFSVRSASATTSWDLGTHRRLDTDNRAANCSTALMDAAADVAVPLHRNAAGWTITAETGTTTLVGVQTVHAADDIRRRSRRTKTHTHNAHGRNLRCYDLWADWPAAASRRLNAPPSRRHIVRASTPRIGRR